MGLFGIAEGRRASDNAYARDQSRHGHGVQARSCPQPVTQLGHQLRHLVGVRQHHGRASNPHGDIAIPAGIRAVDPLEHQFVELENLVLGHRVPATIRIGSTTLTDDVIGSGPASRRSADTCVLRAGICLGLMPVLAYPFLVTPCGVRPNHDACRPRLSPIIPIAQRCGKA